jgi:predicted HicB family RNase H-like nuclease
MTKRPPKVTTETPIGRDDVDLEHEVVRDKSGRRVTDKSVDELVRAARKPGRPSLKDGRSPSIAFRVPADVRAKADKAAAREGKTVSQLAREALEARIK